MRISADMVRLEILNVKDGANSPALPMMMEMLRYGRAHSEVVILEGILPADIYEPLSCIPNTATPFILISRLKRRCGGTKASPTAGISARPKCAAGGARRTTPRRSGKA